MNIKKPVTVNAPANAARAPASRNEIARAVIGAGEPFRLPETQVPDAIGSIIKSATAPSMSLKRLTIDLRCREKWQNYRAEFRFNPRANLYIVQNIRPWADTDAKPTGREQYDIKALRLSGVHCPGCSAAIRAADCRFDNGLFCTHTTDGDGCPGWCDALGLRGR